MPLRLTRPALALTAAVTVAAFSIGLAAMPAQANSIRTHEWWLKSLSVTGAWATSQGAGVTVAVLSDGVDQSQPDLAGAVTTAPAPPGAPVATGQFLGEDGTPIASLIAGRGHGPGGRSGIIGVAPQADILSVPVTLPADDPALSQAAVAGAIPAAIAAGIRYAVSHGAEVIDLPLDPGQPGASGTGGAAAAAGGSPAEQSAVNYALAHNVVLVAPAGDDATSTDAPNFPAAYHGVIAVGAFNSAFVKAPWSSHQSYVTVTAAGAGVRAAANDGQYLTMNSTSAASAVVAGIAALIRSRYPRLSAAAVTRALITSTVFRPPNGRADGSGYGTVNAEDALGAASVLATPKGGKAGHNAKPLLAPGAIPVTSATKSLESQVERAAEESGALLAVLLLLVAGYGLARRRPAVQKAVTPEWTHRQGQTRYPQAHTTDADRMLEIFATPLADPRAPAIAAGTARALPAVSGGGPGVFWPPSGAGLADDDGTVETGRVLGPGPASGAINRRPAVSGSPPWEPAAPPVSELPWTAGPDAESGLGWATADRQGELPAAAAGAGIEALFRPAGPGGADADSLSGPAVRPDMQELAPDPGQAWREDEISHPADVAGPAESWAGHISQPAGGSIGRPSWPAAEPVRSWPDPGSSQVHDLPGEPWADRAGQSRAAESGELGYGEAAPAEARGLQQAPARARAAEPRHTERPAQSWQAERSAQSWQAERSAQSWQAERSAQSWQAERPAQSWQAEQPAQSWREQPAASWGSEQRTGGPWTSTSSSAGDDIDGGPGNGASTSLPWTTSRPRQAAGGPPAQPGQYRIAASGLPVRQPGATYQAAPMSPSGSLWDRAERESDED